MRVRPTRTNPLCSSGMRAIARRTMSCSSSGPAMVATCHSWRRRVICARSCSGVVNPSRNNPVSHACASLRTPPGQARESQLPARMQTRAGGRGLPGTPHAWRRFPTPASRRTGRRGSGRQPLNRARLAGRQSAASWSRAEILGHDRFMAQRYHGLARSSTHIFHTGDERADKYFHGPMLTTILRRLRSAGAKAALEAAMAEYPGREVTPRERTRVFNGTAVRSREASRCGWSG
jgi:hypothetical protein